MSASRVRLSWVCELKFVWNTSNRNDVPECRRRTISELLPCFKGDWSVHHQGALPLHQCALAVLTSYDLFIKPLAYINHYLFWMTFTETCHWAGIKSLRPLWMVRDTCPFLPTHLSIKKNKDLVRWYDKITGCSVTKYSIALVRPRHKNIFCWLFLNLRFLWVDICKPW